MRPRVRVCDLLLFLLRQTVHRPPTTFRYQYEGYISLGLCRIALLKCPRVLCVYVCVLCCVFASFRGQAALEKRVLEATRHATKAVEGEMLARVESDRWRLRCEQVIRRVRVGK